MPAIRRYIHASPLRERLVVRAFGHACDMHKFLNTGDNALHWREQTSTTPIKAGTYVFAGGEWRNVKSMDASALAHM